MDVLVEISILKLFWYLAKYLWKNEKWAFYLVCITFSFWTNSWQENGDGQGGGFTEKGDDGTSTVNFFVLFIYLILIFFIYIYIFNFSLVWVGGLDSLCFSFLLNVVKKSPFLWKNLSFSLYYLFNPFLENLKLSP